MSDLTPGQRLHRRYTLLRPLGRGGMAEVWLVRDDELASEVAAKIVGADADDARIEALQRECRAARRLSHPNILPVFDFHRGEQFHLLTMAHVEGDDLRSLRGAAPERIARTLVPVAAALEHAHTRGVLHRDLKATNVLVDASNELWLFDFGSGALLDEDERDAVRGGGSRFNVGPQQLDGAAPAPADDIYAFGVLLYELLAGAPPFWPDVTPERVRNERPVEPRSSHEIPEQLTSLLFAMLAKSPADRPADMGRVRATLETIARSHSKEAIRLTPPPRAVPIEPIEPPAPRPRARSTSRKRWFSTLPFVAAVIAFVLFDIFVLLPYLRERSRAADDPRSVASATAVVEPPPATPAPTTAEQAANAARGRARDLLRRTLPLERSLEERGVRVWAADEIAEIEERLARGDGQMGAASYADAEETYAGALRDLQLLEARVPEEFERALAAGALALADRDSATAREAFRIAVSIAPDNEIAQLGRRRAETLDRLVELLEQADALERAGRFEPARERYEQAVALDPMSEQAQRALARVDARIGDDRFADWMSRGLAALKEGDHATARRDFLEARALRPNSPGVADGLLQADALEKLETISRLRREALGHEAAERWHEAESSYAAALALDATIVFAQEGRTRAGFRAGLADRLDYHITYKDRIVADAVFEEASALMDEASVVEPAGARHRDQLEALAAILSRAAVTVRVVLASDSRTEVTVYRVGSLGTFETHELNLRPGRYTVVGSRAGYRDVRRTLVVVAGAVPEPFDVRCLEKI